MLDRALAQYFFVLKHQTSFDVRWCKGNVGEKIFQPWVQQMQQRGVTFRQATRATGFVTATRLTDKKVLLEQTARKCSSSLCRLLPKPPTADAAVQ